MKNKLTFDQLIALLAEELDQSRRFTRSFTKELVNIIREGLASDGKVNLSKLGIFELKDVEAREGRDPKTGEPITIPAHQKVVFKPYKKVRKRINAPYEEMEAEFIEGSASESQIVSDEKSPQSVNSSNAEAEKKATESVSSQPASSKSTDAVETSLQNPDTPIQSYLVNHWKRIATIAGISTVLLIIGYEGFKLLRDED